MRALAIRGLFILLPVAICAQLPQRPLNPDVVKMLAYPLTMEKLDRYTQASRNVTALINKDPTYRSRMTPPANEAPKTIEESAAWAKKRLPEYVAAVEKAGMPFREYVIFQGSLMVDYVATVRPRPSSKIKVTPANAAFILKNKVKIDGILAEQNASGGRQ